MVQMKVHIDVYFFNNLCLILSTMAYKLIDYMKLIVFGINDWVFYSKSLDKKYSDKFKGLLILNELDCDFFVIHVFNELELLCVVNWWINIQQLLINPRKFFYILEGHS